MQRARSISRLVSGVLCKANVACTQSYSRSFSTRSILNHHDSLVSPKQQQIRRLNVHEYQGINLLRKYGVNVARGGVASTPQEAQKVAEELQQQGVSDFVVKAQVLAGGRGKGTFTSGLKGGVHVAISPDQVHEYASKMLGNRLVTIQSGPEGKPVNQVFVNERLYVRRENYLAFLLDRSSQGPVLVCSPRGGVNIEEVAHSHPEAILKIPIDIQQGITEAQAEKAAKFLQFNDPTTLPEAKTLIQRLYKLFIEKDCTLLEINPLAETPDRKVFCLDSKLNFDDNADFRQQELFELRDVAQEDPREVEASKSGLNYIGLEGNIGCLVNGAGLAMATLDIIKHHGGSPANFLDLGGGAGEKQVTSALALLNKDHHVKAILVNIFGGIMRCDVIALGLIKSATEIGLKKPIVIRLQGTKVNEAKQLIEESGLRMVMADDLDDAAQKAVRIADIVSMAQQINVKVSFELPL
eukprot:TRINITY_DN9175_c0_g2_i1.p1 TRINITY_DN9175_c0_g2~~TRINITY_DN9175_c0_g2_i1.p1  ORF type:complete len:468 (+),score=133.20 TRINITY_DN9175_c0_g2_i1:74-1477(+)